MTIATRDMHLFHGTGARRAGYHDVDWSDTAIGAPACWSPALRNAASLILESEFPMYLAWGPQLTLLYNAAFAERLGNHHPVALGRPLPQAWPDLWPIVKPLIESALEGRSTYGEDVPRPVYRDGKRVDGWFTLAYSPLRDEGGKVRGVLCVTSETTQRVQLERRHAMQLHVVDSLRRLYHPSDITERACALLGKYLQLDHVCYVEADEEDGSVEVIQDWGRDGDAATGLLSGKRAPLDDFSAAALTLMRTGAPLAVGDVTADPRLPARGARYAEAGVRALLALPLVRRSELKGALVGYAAAPRDWDEEDQRLAADIAERSWEALDRVRASQALRDAVARQTTLLDMNEFRLELADLLRRLRDPGRIFLDTSAMLGRFLQASRVVYGDYDADKDLVTFHSNYTDGLTGPLGGAFQSGMFGPANFAALTQGTWVSSDLQRDPRTGAPDILQHFNAMQIRSCVVVPLNRNGVLSACLFVNDNLPRVWSADIVRLIEDVAERSWSAAERVRAEQALQQADRRKDEFLAMLAHELRNPLAPISAAAQLLNMGTPDSERAQRTSAIIGRQVTHMTGLIDDLLDVSRVTRGLVVLARDEVDLRRVIADAVEQVRPLIEARRHQLALHVAQEPGAACVEGDHKRLVQVIANLLGNAAKYTPEGGRLAVCMDSTAQQVSVSVSDNGIGIPAELLPTVFDLFSQAERTPDRAQGGLGLGLALVKSLAELHGGSVTVTSEGRNMGSEFALRLPRLQARAAPAAPAPAAAADAGAASLNLMLVDDNVDAALTLGLLLEAGGHTVTVVHTPADALACAARQAFDGFLLDIGLPGMSGYELGRRLRKLPGTDKALLVAITGYGQRADQDSAAEAGFDHYFVKPVESQALFGVLAKVGRAE
ncbi:GAF domain-containing protein [Massilia forsythiae]|uniref:histidine kinase n=1 Tax=Massilia forsythiae TaxID=2728020 RepID=A0A7Z2ZTI3_9BURK|nr:ATP-binding protein [Massilia forsythiae]QJE01255.1 GAF domain-containing protein [Massilia forsythiae]